MREDTGCQLTSTEMLLERTSRITMTVFPTQQRPQREPASTGTAKKSLCRIVATVSLIMARQDAKSQRARTLCAQVTHSVVEMMKDIGIAYAQLRGRTYAKGKCANRRNCNNFWARHRAGLLFALSNFRAAIDPPSEWCSASLRHLGRSFVIFFLGKWP